jgi:hypothetical protein
MSEFTIGVDLGQSFDPTAIAVVRKLRQRVGDPIFQVGHLQRLPLQTPYPGVVSHVRGMLTRLPEGTDLVLDYTGVGRPWLWSRLGDSHNFGRCEFFTFVQAVQMGSRSRIGIFAKR